MYRNDRYGRGSKNHFNCKEIDINFNLPPNMQCIGIKTPQCNLYSIYNPNINVSSESWCSILDFLIRACILVGDLNVNHNNWGGSNINHNGLTLNRSILTSDLVLLSDFNSTRLTPPDGVKSVIDLVFASPDIASITQVETYDNTLSRYHFPFLISFSGQKYINNKIIPVHNKRIYSNNAWLEFDNLISNQTIYPPEYSYEQIITDIKSAMDISFSIRQNRVKNKNIPCWWNQYCSDLVKECKLAFCNYKSNPSLNNFLLVRQTEARVKKVFYKLKEKALRNLPHQLIEKPQSKKSGQKSKH